jgi:hypothetical protein
MEIFIPIVIILFIFSLISERLANFLKLNLPEKPPGQTIMGIFPSGPFRTKTDNEYLEKIRERRVLMLAFISALVVSFASKADIFSMLQHMEDANKTLWWFVKDRGIPGYEILIWQTFFGCIFTALFISLGSKFWHDLLDLLLQVKNLKKKLNDERTFTLPDTIENFDEFIKAPESKLALSADEKHHDDLMKIPGVISVGPGYLETPTGHTGCLEVHFNDMNAMGRVPNIVNIILGTMTVPIPVNKIFTGNAFIHADIFGAGIMTANRNKANGWGSLGCIVKKKANVTDKYILSCFHVLSSNSNLSGEELTKDILIRQKNSEGIPEDLVANFTEGVRTEKLDAAIAKIITAPEKFSNALLSNPRIIRKVTPIDVKRKMPVRLFSRMRDAEFNGIVFNDSWRQSLKYPDKDFELEDLIVLTAKIGNNNQTISVKGDSGSLVLDETNQAIGIVVGGDDCFTYAIKMTSIEKQFDIELI